MKRSCSAATLRGMHESHTSSDFDAMLGRAQELLVQMAARVQRQLEDAVTCLDSRSILLIDQVLRHEAVINELERAIDALAGQIIARHTPAAGDLRLVLAFIKITTDLERIGDEAKKIALRARTAGPREHVELAGMAKLTRELVHQALLAIEHLDAGSVAEAAVRVLYATRGDHLRHAPPFSV